VDNRYIVDLWDRAAPKFDQIGPQFFSITGRRLVELAQIAPGDTVLDIAFGRGAILFPAAEKAGPFGSVSGIDLSKEMINQTMAEASRSGKDIQTYQMDASRLTFPNGSFDHLLCGHAIFYFPQAIKEFHRVLKSGGRIGLSVVARGCFDWLWKVLLGYSPNEDGQNNNWNLEQDFDLETADGLKKLLSEHGFTRIQIIEEEYDLLYKNEEEYWLTLWTLETRDILDMMDPTTQDMYRQEVSNALQHFQRPDGIFVPYHVIYAIATKI